MESKQYDIVIYGASGFTGRFVIAEAVRVCSEKKIAVAGRNETKLKNTLMGIESETGKSLQDIGMIIAENGDYESIAEMCRQARLVASCVGPYCLYGENVVKACVEMSTHYVDVSGEPQFLQMCQIKYGEAAKEKGIHIVGSCGFDSVPADVGLEVLRERFPGELTAAESYIHTSGPMQANYGTYATIIESLKNKSNTKEQSKKIFKEALAYVGPKLKRKIGYRDSEKAWAIPFLGSDGSVVKRTQLHESSNFGKTPIQYAAYVAVSFVSIIGLLIFVVAMTVLSKFDFGVKLLEKYPEVFSLGMFRKEGPNIENLYKCGFKVVFHGKGYSEKPKPGSAPGKPDKTLSLKFSGPDLAYIFTSASLIAAAVTILDDKLLNKGGVLTPGSAFRGTGFVDRLKKRGVTIEEI